MKRIYKNIMVILTILCLTSCSDDKLSSGSVVTMPVSSTTEVDLWIKEFLTTPHNIELDYKWVDAETDIGKNLVPPKEEVVLPFLETLKKVWIDVYIDVAGIEFFNTLTPKKIVLIGSANHNTDGTITQGTAEAGRKIVLYELNAFNPNNVPKLKRFFHVIHHEFAHIMHQTRMYDESIYGNITPAGYRSDWHNEREQDALNQGFISKYSRLNPSEDFVEMIATMLTLDNNEFNQLIALATPEGQEALKAKEEFVVAYYKKEWGIDMYEFQAAMAKVLSEIN